MLLTIRQESRGNGGVGGCGGVPGTLGGVGGLFLFKPEPFASVLSDCFGPPPFKLVAKKILTAP